MANDELKKIPAVDKLLSHPTLLKLKELFGSELLTYSVRNVLDTERNRILDGKKSKSIDKLTDEIQQFSEKIAGNSLKPVVNATGIILHTNLGRAPLSKEIFSEMAPILSGYSNLEFDLDTGKRGERTDHIKELLKFITGAEDVLIVNNNAAAVFFILKTFAEKKEVIISRGELIEIGGSFRMPEIMKASGTKMTEVGATNRTRLSDYENAITPNTRLIFKAHKSNYYIGGFSEEVSIEELSKLARKHNLILVYDVGSGLLKKPSNQKFSDEPDIRSCLKEGADLVTFSCDKLIGATQAGIIAGRKDLIKTLSKAPLMRTLRVDKFTIASLNVILKFYLKEENLFSKSPVFRMLNRSKDELLKIADKLSDELKSNQIKIEIVETKAQCGGGALPQLELDSYAVKILPEKDEKNSAYGTGRFADRLFKSLLRNEKPVLGILREGEFLLDVFTIGEEEIKTIVEAIKNNMITDKHL
jgi:L-seryl-tRNA(Ser) seleniumtransferase